jgi:hypothetical protein
MENNDNQLQSMKELYFEADTRKHQQIVASILLSFAKNLIDRAINHDASKLVEPERSHYVDPVFYLNTKNVEYGGDLYKELTAQMGEGWEHHKSVNDHHIEFFIPYSVQTLNDPLRALDLFALVEMLADWIAASRRRGNDSAKALTYLNEKFGVDEQLQAIIRNTLAMMEEHVNAQ